ncbi:hypothetical protein AX16_003042 [Volvariella volvacea WC 439]|nr:hypothetical protein AX16_003042 [Volvariella volvacea WC 439]
MEPIVEFDSAWCPSCDRQIAPKRFIVPVYPDAQELPQLPQQPQPEQPTSPNAKAASKKLKPAVFVRGGGRQGGVRRQVAALKRTDSTKSATSPQHHQQQQQHQEPSKPVKFRTVIDQSPIPLYCSEECQRADLNSTRSVSTFENEIESDLDLESEISTSPSDTVEPSIAALAAHYNFPSIPSTPHFFDDESHVAQPEYPREYSSGVMMAAKRIQAYCPKPPKRSPFDFSAPSRERKTIPGWNDGSNSWRASVYSFSAPKQTSDPLHSNNASKAYRSFAASPHRARGVPSTSDSGTQTAAAVTTEELQNKFADCFTRRSKSRASHSSSPQRKERSILKPGAEGRLLVPDVKLKVHSGSSTSLVHQARRAAAKARSEASEEDSEKQGSASLPPTDRRPVVESRSLSYDNLKTYPIMQMPRRKETRLQRQVVDGVEVFVEVEVEVEPDTQRLFNFPIPWEEYQRRRAHRRS